MTAVCRQHGGYRLSHHWHRSDVINLRGLPEITERTLLLKPRQKLNFFCLDCGIFSTDVIYQFLNFFIYSYALPVNDSATTKRFLLLIIHRLLAVSDRAIPLPKWQACCCNMYWRTPQLLRISLILKTRTLSVQVHTAPWFLTFISTWLAFRTTSIVRCDVRCQLFLAVI